MNQSRLQEQVDELSRSLRLSGDEINAHLIDLQARIDQLKIDIAAINAFLESKYPEFPDAFEQKRREKERDLNPEAE